mmetsp:Transcript_26873/g.66539  ORF Transcript_26873/g.66539 Transcript_26873/m.66539 type:complete len:252 (+) Transcript_26873:680-1435(+)
MPPARSHVAVGGRRRRRLSSRGARWRQRRRVDRTAEVGFLIGRGAVALVEVHEVRARHDALGPLGARQLEAEAGRVRGVRTARGGRAAGGAAQLDVVDSAAARGGAQAVERSRGADGRGGPSRGRRVGRGGGGVAAAALLALAPQLAPPRGRRRGGAERRRRGGGRGGRRVHRPRGQPRLEPLVRRGRRDARAEGVGSDGVEHHLPHALLADARDQLHEGEGKHRLRALKRREATGRQPDEKAEGVGDRDG